MVTRKPFVTLLRAGSVALPLSTFLFVGSVWKAPHGFIGSALGETNAILRDSQTQWMVFLSLGIYFSAFNVLQSFAGTAPSAVRKSWCRIPTTWLCCFLAAVGARYAFDYLPSILALTLLA